jgi:hypothetical protein
MAMHQTDNSEQEKLAFLASGKQYKSRCSNCRKLGHKQDSCWQLSKNPRIPKTLDPTKKRNIAPFVT